MGPYTYLVLNTCNWRKISCAFLLFHMIIQVYAKICRISQNAASLMPCGQLAYSGLYPTQRHYISIPGNFWLGKNFDFLFSYQILTWKQNSLQRQCRGSNHFSPTRFQNVPDSPYTVCLLYRKVLRQRTWYTAHIAFIKCCDIQSIWANSHQFIKYFVEWFESDKLFLRPLSQNWE